MSPLKVSFMKNIDFHLNNIYFIFINNKNILMRIDIVNRLLQVLHYLTNIPLSHFISFLRFVDICFKCFC